MIGLQSAVALSYTCRIGWSVTYYEHLKSFQDGYQLVMVQTHDGFKVCWRMIAVRIPASGYNQSPSPVVSFMLA